MKDKNLKQLVLESCVITVMYGRHVESLPSTGFKVRRPFVKCVLLFYRINLLNLNSRLCHMYKIYGVHNTLIGVLRVKGLH